MERPVLRLRLLAIPVSILVLVIAAVVWVGAVEYWIGQQLRAFAAARLNPVLAFDELEYSFPRTIALRGARLSSPDPEATGEWIEILATDSLSMVLTRKYAFSENLHFQKIEFLDQSLLNGDQT